MTRFLFRLVKDAYNIETTHFPVRAVASGCRSQGRQQPSGIAKKLRSGRSRTSSALPRSYTLFFTRLTRMGRDGSWTSFFGESLRTTFHFPFSRVTLSAPVISPRCCSHCAPCLRAWSSFSLSVARSDIRELGTGPLIAPTFHALSSMSPVLYAKFGSTLAMRQTSPSSSVNSFVKLLFFETDFSGQAMRIGNLTSYSSRL